MKIGKPCVGHWIAYIRITLHNFKTVNCFLLAEFKRNISQCQDCEIVGQVDDGNLRTDILASIPCN